MVRAAVKDLYPNPTWAAKVDKMQDDQVLAIYYHDLQKTPESEQDKGHNEKPPEQDTLF
jgi:hypothetical protein